MVTPMLRPDLWGGLATHAGDALFEICYLPAFPASAPALRDCYDGTFDAFGADFRVRPAFTTGDDHTLRNDWCVAAGSSVDDDGTVHLPYDPQTGALVPAVWDRWLAHDPVRMATAPAHTAARPTDDLHRCGQA
jgi:hypothetical protein